jgi:hypothetical protein
MMKRNVLAGILLWTTLLVSSAQPTRKRVGDPQAGTVCVWRL